MEKKDRIFSKLNIKDYTNRLEKILEKKKFSLDTRNLLLSMLYKIENGYADYEKAKVNVPNKNDFIEHIFTIIQNNCNEIIVAEFNSEASQILKEKKVQYIIDKDQGKIIAFANELLVLKCILAMEEYSVCVSQEKQILQFPISEMLMQGNRMNQEEVIRDFNGWSWDIMVKEISDININVVFQTLLYLTGNKFIEEWMKNDSNLADYLELLQSYLKDNYGDKIAQNFITLFCKIAIDNAIRKNKDQYKLWQNKLDTMEEEFNKLQNKTKYLSSKTKEKKEYTKQIEEIDKILNNKDLLKQEYTSRNEKLPNKEKIFSISHLVDRLGKERIQLLEKIKKCNELIDPKGYVERKQKIESNVEFLRMLDINKEKNQTSTIIELCHIFLECFEIKIAKATTKREILDYIYQLRYYEFLTIDSKGKKIKEVAKLKTLLKNNRKELLTKAKQLDVIEDVTDDEKVNSEILNNIFDSKMIDLDHMVVEIKIQDGKIVVEYYDEKVLETTIQVESDKTVKLKKKVKLFI